MPTRPTPSEVPSRPIPTWRAKLIDVALRSGADAVHPGYGFLAENADFAEAVIEAGLAWIGPPAQAIRDLGDKTVARRLAAAVGAPLVPGLAEPAHDVSEIRSFAAEHGFPLLIKAAFGGGGRGMKVVRGPDELDQAYESAVRESTAAFGRGECFVERYLEHARHLETQCLADRNGHVAVLSTRDCSLQRRNQKLIEEAPAPFLTDEQVDRLYDASKAILAEAGYVNAGTCEFLLAPDGTISFNEVNTRLQVEHPVTELVTGVDVVQEQLRIASGGLIDYEDPAIVGHAIEFRVNGEDPAADFLPSPGRLRRWRVPSGPGVRWDGAYEEGDELPAEFDSLLGKLVVYGPTGVKLWPTPGVPWPSSGSTASPPCSRWTGSSSITPTSWRSRFGCTPAGSRPSWPTPSKPSPLPRPLRTRTDGRRRLTVEVDGRRVEVTLPEALAISGPRPPTATAPTSPAALRRAPERPHAVTSPMQAKVVKVVAANGQHVERGETVIDVEAMKMEQSLPGSRTDGSRAWPSRSGTRCCGASPVPCDGRPPRRVHRDPEVPGPDSTASRLADLDERRRQVSEQASRSPSSDRAPTES